MDDPAAWSLTGSMLLFSGLGDTLPTRNPAIMADVLESEATLDAAGFHHTLHILEGIATEGKRWINNKYRPDDD